MSSNSSPDTTGTPAVAAQSTTPSSEGNSGRLRRLGKRLGLLLASTLVACLLLEGLVLLVFGEQPKFPRHVVEAPWGLRYNQPNATYRHKSADMTTYFRINSQGMRADQDYSYDKPADTLRILSLGDSYTAGYEVDVEDCFSSVLESELREAGLDVQVLNAGVSGYSNAEACLYLEKELYKYDPDLVMLSFYVNDLVDNVRTGLFALQDGELVQTGDRYVPAGRLGNFLNTNWFFSFLAERSNAFVLLKEMATRFLKREAVRSNEEAVTGDAAKETPIENEPPAEVDPAVEQREILAARIIERMYEFARERGIPLVIHSIPSPQPTKDVPHRNWPLAEKFPLEHFDVDRPGLLFVPSKEVLDPYVGEELLTWQRSHYHWTPFSHEVAGKNLAREILDAGLLPSVR